MVDIQTTRDNSHSKVKALFFRVKEKVETVAKRSISGFKHQWLGKREF